MRLPPLPELSFRLLYYVLLTFVAVAIVEPQLFKSHRRSQWVYAPRIQYSAMDVELSRILQTQPIAIDGYSYEPFRARKYVFAGLAITFPCALILLWRRRRSGTNERPRWRVAYFALTATVLVTLASPLWFNPQSSYIHSSQIRYHSKDPNLNARLKAVNIGIDGRTWQFMSLQESLVCAIIYAWGVVGFYLAFHPEIVLVGNIQPRGRAGPAAIPGRPAQT